MKKTKTKYDDLSRSESSFVDISMTFAFGLYRLHSAEAASLRLSLALMDFNISQKAGLDGSGNVPLQHLDKIPIDSYEYFKYVSNISFFVYATSLLDSFLNDTTLFLLLLKPGSISESSKISFKTLLSSKSINDAITTAATAKCKDISHKSIDERISFLRKTFGICKDIQPDTMYNIKRCSNIRNTAIHDQGCFEIKLDKENQVTTKIKSCIYKPTPITKDDIDLAISTYKTIASSIAKSVFLDILKSNDTGQIHETLEALTLSARAFQNTKKQLIE